MKVKHIWLIILLTVLFLLFASLPRNCYYEGLNDSINEKIFVINLDKDKRRYKEFQENYKQTDFANLSYTRFSGVNGKDEDPNNWLAEHAMSEFNEVNNNGFRTKHHQLTYGGLGCFLSHYRIIEQLNRESNEDIQYIIFEDDIKPNRNAKSKLYKFIQQAPEDWDVLVFQTWKSKGKNVNKHFKKLNSFWGTGLNVINKKGAKKIADELNVNKIDGQIDSYLSRMSIQGKLNVYGCNDSITQDNSKNESNIQTPLIETQGVNPDDYFGIMM